MPVQPDTEIMQGDPGRQDGMGRKADYPPLEGQVPARFSFDGVHSGVQNRPENCPFWQSVVVILAPYSHYRPTLYYPIRANFAKAAAVAVNGKIRTVARARIMKDHSTDHEYCRSTASDIIFMPTANCTPIMMRSITKVSSTMTYLAWLSTYHWCTASKPINTPNTDTTIEQRRTMSDYLILLRSAGQDHRERGEVAHPHSRP